MSEIIYIANSRIPTEKAHGLQIIKMSEAMANAGTGLTLILPGRRQTLEFKGKNIFQYYRVKENFTIKNIKSFDPAFLLKLSRGGLYIKVQTLFFILSLIFYFIFHRPDRSVIFYTRDASLLFVLQLFSKNIVWEAHDLPKHAGYYLNTWKKCRRVVAITGGLKKDLVSAGLNAKKVLVASDGVDLVEFGQIKESKEALRQKLNLPLNKKIITYAGHLYQWKGAQVLADSAQILGDEYLVVFVGGTKKDVDDFKKKNGQNKNILILGQKPHEQMPFYLSASDVLVLPNSAKSEISKTYTSPLKLFEYMASGRPIVASSLPSIKEILNEKNSILVAPDDAVALASGIKIAVSPGSEKISHLARLDVNDYTWLNRAKNILNFIKIND